jgi:hypothetical protein
VGELIFPSQALQHESLVIVRTFASVSKTSPKLGIKGCLPRVLAENAAFDRPVNERGNDTPALSAIGALHEPGFVVPDCLGTSTDEIDGPRTNFFTIVDRMVGR